MEQKPHQFESVEPVRNRDQRVCSNVPEGSTVRSLFGDYDCSGLPVTLAVTREEVALLRAFLAAEIDAILYGDEIQRGEK